jgi:uncharacterized protein (DUF849 family)
MKLDRCRFNEAQRYHSFNRIAVDSSIMTGRAVHQRQFVPCAPDPTPFEIRRRLGRRNCRIFFRLGLPVRAGAAVKGGRKRRQALRRGKCQPLTSLGVSIKYFRCVRRNNNQADVAHYRAEPIISHRGMLGDRMQRNVIISCAVTGSADTPGKNPAVPVNPPQIAQSAIDAAKAGAAIVHIHVRDPVTTRPSMDGALYREVVERIRDSGSDVLINLTTGPGARFVPGMDDPFKPGPATNLKTPTERVAHVLALRPDICSLDMGSMNMGNYVFVNPPGYLEAMAVAVRDAGVLPELEVFETGHLLLAKRMIETGHIKRPGLFQICLGIAWAQPATTEAMSYMRSLLPPDAIWFAFGISVYQFPMVAQAILLGGHVRVGFEDNLYLAKGKLAPSNAALVEKAGRIIELLGDNVATVAQARDMLRG